MITAIVQARLGSSRLPGKVLKTVNGMPLLEIELNRLKLVSSINQIIVATTSNENDKPIADFCKKNNIDYFCGSESDVLDRFYQAICQFGGTHIVRITGDCPLLSPRICTELINFYETHNLDYVHSGSTVAEGLDCEIFSFNSLKKCWQEAKKRTEREHLTMYMHNHPDLFKKHTYNLETDDSNFRVTVDEEKDFIVVENILKHFWDKKFTVEWDEIKKWLLANKEIMSINSQIIRNEGYARDVAKEKAAQNQSVKN